MDESERQYWFNYWQFGSLAIYKWGKLMHCLHLVNQLKINGSSVDLHIQEVSPHVGGGVTTSIGGHQFFNDLDELQAILEVHLNELKKSYGVGT